MGIFLYPYLRLIIIFSVLCFISIYTYAEGSLEGRDTLVYKPHRDTVRLTKAQVFDLKSSESLIYYKPRPFEFVTNVPSDLVQFGKAVVAKDNLGKLAIVLGASAVLIAFDQPILDGVQQFGRYINLDATRDFKRGIYFNVGNTFVPVMDIPQNLNSGIYFIGEGWPSILIAGGMYGYGMISNDYRAKQTASQLAEMFFTLAITCQTLKRITGRQSPMLATKPGGEWNPLTNFKTYQADPAEYDAFPSGHMATVMATVTILAGNYPDSKFIKPIGYSIMGLLGFAMINNGVHWMGDYPVAIAIGYTCGKIALRHGQQTIKKKTGLAGSNATLMPLVFGQNGYGLSYRLTF